MQTTDHLNVPSKLVEALPGPQVLEALFHNLTWSWVWLTLRLWLGLDRWMMPAVGMPWKPGYLFERSNPGEVEAPEDLNGFPPPAR